MKNELIQTLIILLIISVGAKVFYNLIQIQNKKIEKLDKEILILNKEIENLKNK
jgi:cell division protein FtsB